MAYRSNARSSFGPSPNPWLQGVPPGVPMQGGGYNMQGNVMNQGGFGNGHSLANTQLALANDFLSSALKHQGYGNQGGPGLLGSGPANFPMRGGPGLMGRPNMMGNMMMHDVKRMRMDNQNMRSGGGYNQRNRMQNRNNQQNRNYNDRRPRNDQKGGKPNANKKAKEDDKKKDGDKKTDDASYDPASPTADGKDADKDGGTPQKQAQKRPREKSPEKSEDEVIPGTLQVTIGRGVKGRSVSKEGEPNDDDVIDKAGNVTPFDPNKAVGRSFLVPLSGLFCKVCRKFYKDEDSAKQHCQTKTHYENCKKTLLASRSRKAKGKKSEEEQPGTEKSEDGGADQVKSADDTKSEKEEEPKHSTESVEDDHEEDELLGNDEDSKEATSETKVGDCNGEKKSDESKADESPENIEDAVVPEFDKMAEDVEGGGEGVDETNSIQATDPETDDSIVEPTSGRTRKSASPKKVTPSPRGRGRARRGRKTD